MHIWTVDFGNQYFRLLSIMRNLNCSIIRQSELLIIKINYPDGHNTMLYTAAQLNHPVEFRWRPVSE